ASRGRAAHRARGVPAVPLLLRLHRPLHRRDHPRRAALPARPARRSGGLDGRSGRLRRDRLVVVVLVRPVLLVFGLLVVLLGLLGRRRRRRRRRLQRLVLMRVLRALAALAVGLAPWVAAALGPPVPAAPTSYVTDKAGILPGDVAARLERTLRDF